MKIPWRTLKWAGALVALALAIFSVDVLRVGGAFRSVQSEFAGSSEEFQLDRERGLAYLSLLDRDGVEFIIGALLDRKVLICKPKT